MMIYIAAFILIFVIAFAVLLSMNRRRKAEDEFLKYFDSVSVNGGVTQEKQFADEVKEVVNTKPILDTTLLEPEDKEVFDEKYEEVDDDFIVEPEIEEEDDEPSFLAEASEFAVKEPVKKPRKKAVKRKRTTKKKVVD